MKKVEKNSREYFRFIEIILLLIVIFLVIVLIVLEIMHNEYVSYERAYEYDAYKVENTENTVNVTLYHKEGEIIKTEENYYFENGKILKNEIKYYYERISFAKDEYNSIEIMIQENLKSGLSEPTYSLEKQENAVIYTYLNPEISLKSSLQTKTKILDLDETFESDEEILTYLLKYIDEKYGQYYTKVK